MIKDVVLTELKQFKDDNGKVMQMLRNDSTMFRKFGEIYFSVINPYAIKAWRLHKQMTVNLVVIYGKVKVVLYDKRKHSATFREVQEFVLSPEDYKLITIPPQIWTGFQSIHPKESIVANCADLPHNPNEQKRISFDSSIIPYKWI